MVASGALNILLFQAPHQFSNTTTKDATKICYCFVLIHTGYDPNQGM